MSNPSESSPVYHLDTPHWLTTSQGDPRGYIKADRLTELWFHTGTTCNLRCPFCLEGSKPGCMRIEPLTLADAQPLIDEALTLGVKQFSFTGGEPFVVPDAVRLLEATLDHRPTLLLTNGTEPLLNRMGEVIPLLDRPNPLNFRISLDYPDAERHDVGRGRGTFATALRTMQRLQEAGFEISMARHREVDENVAEVDDAFRKVLAEGGVDPDIKIISFPEFLLPGAMADVPEITENCMTKFHSPETRANFMCSFSRFALKKDGKMRVYACTLVDDQVPYDLGGTLTESLRPRVTLGHHRCYSCFAFGASCSEG